MMSSSFEIESASHSPGFWDSAGVRYIVTICLVLLVGDLYLIVHTYNCLSSGNDYECTYDVGRLRELGIPVRIPQMSLMLDSIEITLLWNMVQLPVAIIAFAPAYVIATHISRRYRIHQNLGGIIFWFVAWIMAALTLPLVAELTYIFDTDHVSWRIDIFRMLMFAAAGASCGIVSCLLAIGDRPMAAR
jgi:hypothetical protein